MLLKNETEFLHHLRISNERSKDDFSASEPLSFVGDGENDNDLVIFNKEFANQSINLGQKTNIYGNTYTNTHY
jgi:hypothetical protein